MVILFLFVFSSAIIFAILLTLRRNRYPITLHRNLQNLNYLLIVFPLHFLDHLIKSFHPHFYLIFSFKIILFNLLAKLHIAIILFSNFDFVYYWFMVVIFIFILNLIFDSINVIKDNNGSVIIKDTLNNDYLSLKRFKLIELLNYTISY